MSHVLILGKQYGEAEALLTRSLSIEQASFGELHSQVASAWNELGVLAYMRGQNEEADAAFRKALLIYTTIYGPKHQFVGLCYSNLVGVSMHRKEYTTAESYARKALEIYAVSLPPDHINPAIAHLKLGRCLLRQGRYMEARRETLSGVQYFATHGSRDNDYLVAGQKDLSEIDAHLSGQGSFGPAVAVKN